MSHIKMAFVGDIMCGDSFYSIGHGVASSIEKYGNDFMSPEIVNFLSSHDIVLGNIESPLSDIGRKEKCLRTLHMRGKPEVVKYLANWGFNIAHVANNHILEHGKRAAIDTVNNLRQAGIKTIGAGEKFDFLKGLQIEELFCGRHEIAFIGTCLRDEKYAFNGGERIDEIIEAIKHLNKRDKIVCISIHWGDEFLDRPATWQKQLAELLIDAGAKIIIGHHPHVVQGIQILRGSLIAYSLGNFVFDSFLEDTTWSTILSVIMAGKQIVDYVCTPIIKDKKHRPMLAKNEDKQRIELEIERRCNLITMEIAEKAYQEQYESDVISLDSKARHKLHLELAKRFIHFDPIYWPQILWRPIQRRLKIW